MTEKKARRTLRDIAPLFLSPAERSRPEAEKPHSGKPLASRVIGVYSASSEHSSEWTTAFLANFLSLQAVKPLVLLGTPAYRSELIAPSAGGPEQVQGPASTEAIRRSIQSSTGPVLVSLTESGYLPEASDLALLSDLLVTCSPDGASCERAYRFSKWAFAWAPWLRHALIMDQVQAQDLAQILRSSMEAIYMTFLSASLAVLGWIPPVRKHQALNDRAWLQAAASSLDWAALKRGSS